MKASFAYNASMIYSVPQGNKFRCTLCPHECVLDVGERGKCLARVGKQDGVYLHGFGRITTMAVEPIEKKPLFHYHPGMMTLSVGFYGCSMACDYCQNWKVSQQNRHDTAKIILPKHLVQIARDKQCPAICFTYNEPTVYFEYVQSVANHAKEYGIKIILKTNGMLNREPWEEILKSVDALNIDWKGEPDRCEKITGIAFQGTARIFDALRLKKHVEISIPVFSGTDVTDYMQAIHHLCGFDDDCPVPIHLLRVYPAHLVQMVNTTSDDLIEEVAQMYRKSFAYVYTPKEQNTVCPLCKTVNIRRKALKVGDEEYSTCEQCNKLFAQIHKKS